MRVLHVHSGFVWRGGERQVLDLMRGLRERGVPQGCLASRGGALAGRLREEGLPVRAIPLRNEGDPRAFARILREIRATRPDVVHAHTSQAHGLAAAALRLAGRRRPALVVTRRVEHSIFRHRFLGLDRWKYDPGADLVLCVSEFVRQVLVADGLRSERLRVVPDGVDVARLEREREERTRTRSRLGLPRDATVVGHVGALVPEKGHAFLLRAALRLLPRREDLFVLLIGEGPLRRALEAEARASGLAARVRFLGHRSDVPSLLGAMDLFLFPSLHEGLGTSLLEAMALGVPVVASRVGGIPEAVRDGRDGWLVPPADPDALGGAITEALNGRAEGVRRAASARARVVDRFDLSRTVAATLEAYETARLTRRRRPFAKHPAPAATSRTRSSPPSERASRGSA